MELLKGMALLLLCQSAGEVLARIAHLPLPGPVLGLLLLWLLLNWPAVRPSVASAAEPLLSHLSLLFVPVGVGVIVHAGLIAQYGVRMLAGRAAVDLAGTGRGRAGAARLPAAHAHRHGHRGPGEPRCLTSSNCGSTCRRRRCSG